MNRYLLTRHCPRCKQDKPEDAFSYRNRARMWLSSYCKPCLAVAQRVSRMRGRA